MGSAYKTSAEFGPALIQKYFKAMIDEAQGVKSGADPECVHRMRVASRRLRTALSIFDDCLPSKKSEKFRKKIRGLAAILGEARDADVKIVFLNNQLLIPKKKNYADGIRRIILRTEQKRKRLQPVLIKELERALEGGFFTDMEKTFSCSFKKTKRGHSLRSRFAEETAWRLEEVLGYEDIIKSPENIEELHDLRIAIKHLRYCLEIFDRAVGGIEEYVNTAKNLQEIIGEIHDCDMWLDFIPQFIVKEEKMTVDYCGSLTPLMRLRPGINWLYEDRREFRQKKYSEFIDAWDDTKGLWATLNVMVDDILNRK